MADQQPNIFLHIGTEKTGTTTLQALGGINRDKLKRDGIYYPASPGDRNQIKLTLFASEHENTIDLRRVVGLYEEPKFREFRANLPAQLRDEIAASGCKTVYLSNEHLSSRVREVADVRRLADLLQNLGQVKVVCYVRPQHDLFLSSYSTSIKSGNIHDPNPPTDAGDYYYNYEKMLSVWAEGFGEDSIIVRPYDRKTLLGGDLVVDFFSLLGYEKSADIDVPADRNPSLDAYTLQFMLVLNKYLPRFLEATLNPDRDDISNALEAISKGPKIAMQESALRGIMQTFEESNAAVARRFLKRDDGQLFDNLRFQASTDAVEFDADRAVEIAAHIWRWKERQLLLARERIARLEKRLADKTGPKQPQPKG